VSGRFEITLDGLASPTPEWRKQGERPGIPRGVHMMTHVD
jgi:hypothetical protein